jgi:endonuclease-3 related protein
MTLQLSKQRLRKTFHSLASCYGPQYWWPAESPFEVMVGAVLTQNTAWLNVERAIQNLIGKNRLSAERLVAARHDHLARWLRPAGYFNVKATRLKNFCQWYLGAGSFAALKNLDTETLRQSLLKVNGVGRETADDILLYAFERPVFVVDAYTRRFFVRLGFIQGDEDYDQLRLAIETALGPDVSLYNEYHALIVRHAREACRVRPLCTACVLEKTCPATGV